MWAPVAFGLAELSPCPAAQAARVRWLPVHHRKGFWTALIDSESGKPLAYIDLDPY